MAMILSPEVERLVEARVHRGDFASADEVVLAALNALDEQELTVLDEETLAAIKEGERQADAGLGRPWDEVFEEFRARAKGQPVNG